MKKLLSLVLTAIMLTPFSAAAANYSGWAHESVNMAIYGGVVAKDTDFKAAITRAQIAELFVKAYENVTESEAATMSNHFTDTNSEYVIKAYALGIMNGTSDTEFSPNTYTTRQEMAKIILSYKSTVDEEAIELPENPDCDFYDFYDVADWAKPYVAKATEDGIINGYADGSFMPAKAISYEEAIALIVRCYPLNQTVTEPAPSREVNLSSLSGTVSHGEVRIKWGKSAGSYTVLVTQSRNSYYEGDIAPETKEYLCYNNYLDINLNPNRKYKITISGDANLSCSFKTAEVIGDGRDAISASYPTTQEEATPLMVEVTVPVWRLSGGKKISSTATFTVHHMIADKVKLVFEDIYNGEEQFPIRDVGGYAWRGGRSEHNGGTAIDINYNENYCIYNNGTVIGKYWKPGEDVYSIKPYGDVVNAFERHGFTWGGDAWRNPRDYMHFSYLGT